MPSNSKRIVARAFSMIAAAALLASYTACNDSTFTGSAAQTAKKPGSGSEPTSGPTGSPTGGNPTGSPTGGEPTGSPTGGGNPGSPTGGEPPGTGTDCVKGDLVNVPFSGPAKDCFDAGKTWNFSKASCQDIRKAKFECTWDNILQWFKTTNLVPTEAVQNGVKDGRKVVSCGESEDGNRLVVIWLNPPQNGTIQCDNAKALEGLAVTGCYTFYPDPSKSPPKPTTDEEKKQQVYACMDAL